MSVASVLTQKFPNGRQCSGSIERNTILAGRHRVIVVNVGNPIAFIADSQVTKCAQCALLTPFLFGYNFGMMAEFALYFRRTGVPDQIYLQESVEC